MGHCLLLFGPQALAFDEAAFHQLQSVLAQNPTHRWILDTMAELPEWFNTISKVYPAISKDSGRQLLRELNIWLKTGHVTGTPFPLPNILLNPLVTAFQLVQYAKYSSPDTAREVNTRQPTETLGFCTGLLAALAVSSSTSQADLQKYGSVALRLGMLIGMVVDAQETSSPSRSFATKWASAEIGEETAKIIKSYPEAYVSVAYDENRATVTTSAKTASALDQQLKDAGTTVTDLALHGRFHWQHHRETLDDLIAFCDSYPEFQFADAAHFVRPTRSNIDGNFITTEKPHHEALRSILVEKSLWYSTFRSLQSSSLRDATSRIVSFGTGKCVPPSLLRDLSQRVVHMADSDEEAMAIGSPSKFPRGYSDNAIAVVGMSCKTAGADNLEEFWDLLCGGKSQHREVPSDRFDFDTPFRNADTSRKWYGNFLNDHDKFDHKFFKKSPREMSSTDPQQRLLLEIAYQAVEQSGYFHSQKLNKRIGCYVGVCAVDYENNIACHGPNAFSATGNLRGFIAGKVSHYFGWTGPGLTIDTACSSSAVAVHQACKAILSGECEAALAGGTHVMTSPLWFQNLAGASFLSTTGACKPFDAKADGYCRGEGVAAVFLKKMSTAIADGDQILGTIAGTAVQQNQNCTPIFVPNSTSLSDLFQVVTKQANLKAEDISVVEAHGTGTPVGDPAEYESVRQVLGGTNRSSALMLGSVKGLVGHAECTSGILSLIKTLLMILKAKIPPQASFTAMNPAIKATAADHIKIPTTLQAWDARFRAALINNYGASGSNASLIITQAPTINAIAPSYRSALPSGTSRKCSFWLAGLDDRSLRAYSKALRSYIRHDPGVSKELSLPQLAFNMARQSNRHLDRSLMFSCRSTDELEASLLSYENGASKLQSVPTPPQKPMILCFGGQVSQYIGLDRHLYENVAVFRSFIDECNAACLSIGAQSIFPNIFQRTPVEDPVRLQTMIFATQYACAKTWIACGVQPVAIVGHSFGELTALCISDVLGLQDTLRLIVGRATVVRETWGPDKGSMMAVEADLKDVELLLSKANATDTDYSAATIGCFNGPRSFTLAGSTQAIEKIAETICKDSAFSSMRSKKLQVTNAFHSKLVDPLIDSLEASARNLSFREPTIPIWRATELDSCDTFSPKFVADHMRSPVYFNHAVQRLAKQYPSCVWLEAGSASTVTNMAGRALSNPANAHFQSINITCDNALDNLNDATLSLWKAGCKNISFWGHHSSQTAEHAPLLLPPYQFEKARHWVDLKKVPQPTPTQPAAEKEALPDGLLTFINYRDSQSRCARFRINTAIPKYERLIAGHVIAETAPICPATVQLDLAIEALRSLRPDLVSSGLQPQIQGVKNQSPVCPHAGRSVWLDLETLEGAQDSWSFRTYSTDSGKGAAESTHTTGGIVFRSPGDPQVQLEFARYERLSGHQRCLDILNSSDADDIIQGRNIYRTFNEIVRYGEDYQGLQKLAGLGNISAGRVVKRYNPETWLDAHLSDSFCQVGGIWVNCMTNRDPADMYIANGIEQWIRSPKLRPDHPRPEKWDVSAYHHGSLDKAFTTDVFVFDSATGDLMEVILGINYVRIPKASMSKLLSRLTAGDNVPSVRPSLTSSPTVSKLRETPPELSMAREVAARPMAIPVKIPSYTTPRRHSPNPDVLDKVKAILVELSGLELSEITDNAELANLGIDSLMGMEMAREIETTLSCSLPIDQLAEVTDMPGLMRCVHVALGSDMPPSEGAMHLVETPGEVTPGSATPSTFSSSEDGGYTSISSVSSDAGAEDTDLAALKKTPEPIAIIQQDFAPASGDLELPARKVFDAFRETKALTDQFIVDYGCYNYVETVLPAKNEMCVSLAVEAFEQMGCPIGSASAGEEIERVTHIREHNCLVDYLYLMLEKEGRLIDIDGGRITRTAVPAPSKSSEEFLHDLLRQFPDHGGANKLTHYAGANLVDVLTGKTDGIKLIFGSEQGRELVSALYGDWPLNKLYYKQMEDFLSRLSAQLPKDGAPLKILEMGAGTGGTTKWLVPLLARLDTPVEYTFTDLAPSFVAAARKKYKHYPFMKFRTHNIEKPPSDDLVGTQHIVVASNAVHATHSLTESGTNIRKMLRPDGLLMMLEMTGTLYWVDIVFGLFEGWWLFDDGRTHAVTNELRWKKELQSIGYGHVDWTDGDRPENKVERLIIAMASGSRYDNNPTPSMPAMNPSADGVARKALVDEYVSKMTHDFKAPVLPAHPDRSRTSSQCVLITGGTGSVGCHLIANLAANPDVESIICLNRRSKQEPNLRQQQALVSKGIALSAEGAAKLTVIESDMTKPNLGLDRDAYQFLSTSVTHIIHNAWLMSAKRALKGFESQFQIMRHLIDLSRDASQYTPSTSKVTFQFISSIAVVGHYPLWTQQPHVPENPMPIEAVLPNGYGDAKYVCELMLDPTLRKYPDRFRTSIVRIGQIAGSTSSGYWNSMEHLPFLWKSSQTLRALPDFDGVLSWTPVNDVAGTLVDIALDVDEPHQVYHIDNPIRQPWKEMSPILADAMGISRDAIVPFAEWVKRVKDLASSGAAGAGLDNDANPAAKLIDFLDDNFTRMSCGGLLLGVEHTLEHSKTLRAVGPMGAEYVRKVVGAWKETGFLK